MRRLPLILAALLLGLQQHSAADTRSVGYLTPGGAIGAEDSAVLRWLASDTKLTFRALELDDIVPVAGAPEGPFAALRGIDVLWIHVADSAAYERWKPSIAALKPLRSWYEAGGRFLFTGLAAMIPHAIGIESAAPTVEVVDVEDDWLFDQRGFQSFRPWISSPERGHPLFDGLLGGAFVLDGDRNARLWCAGYFGDAWPTEGKVVAVEKSTITIGAERKLVVEYRTGRGRALAIGAFIRFAGVNRAAVRMERFMENALLDVASGRGPGDETLHWTKPDLAPKEMEVPERALEVIEAGWKDLGKPATRPAAWKASDLVIRRDSATSNFYDVAGNRVLVMGKEKGGIDEIWTHPFRLLRDYRAGMVSGDSVLWFDRLPAKIAITPEAFTRSYATPVGEVREIVFCAMTSPSAVVRYDFPPGVPGTLVTAFRTDLRLMWPYDLPATGGVRYGYERESGTLILSDGPKLVWGFVGADARPEAHLTGRYDSVWWGGDSPKGSAGGFRGRVDSSLAILHATAYDIGERSGRGITLVFSGHSGPRAEASGHVTVLADPAAEYEFARVAAQNVLDRSLSIDTPDDNFDRLFSWAIVGTNRFLVNTPGIGEGLLAGYGTTARGWDGAQKVSGRPGYAWYFGRDAAWSGFAIDDYGDFATVRKQLQLFQRYQDFTGKIFHEISTSGSVHYDASDATPLYVQLAAHYLRASGDTAFLRESWPNLRRAMDYLRSTDTDGDGLIENTNEGHGWVEGGALYPVHTEFYLAGAWAKALSDAAYIASVLRMDDAAERYRDDAKAVTRSLNRDFWNSGTRFFNMGKKADGSYNTEPTVLPATVLYHGIIDDERAAPVLERYAGQGFSTDWGVRIVSSASTLFNPQGYHYGSVWPLFTGWTALAEYAYGRPTQAFSHVMDNLSIKNHWALGFVEEVMHGAVYQPSGVCSHQCWSETNILHPAITGMIGWKPDAPAHAAGLYPRFPISWDTVAVRNLRVDGVTVSVSMARGPGATTWTFVKRGSDSLSLSFAPQLPEGMEPTRVLLDGKEISTPDDRRRGLLDPAMTIAFPVSRGDVNRTLVIEHRGGVGVIPLVANPQPGDSSTGCRIISEAYDDGEYELTVEGRVGSTTELEVRGFGLSIAGVDNAKLVGNNLQGTWRLAVAFPPSTGAFSTVNVRVRVE